MPGIARLRALSKAAACLRDSDDADVREVGRQLAVWIEGGAALPLDRVLGLRQHGGVSLRRALAIADRNRILRDLVRGHPEWSVMEPALIGRRMHLAFERYAAGRWQRDRHQLVAPSAEPFASFWRLLRAGAPMPGPDRLRQIIAHEIQDPV